MTIIRCESCGAELVPDPDASTVVCESCGAVQTLPAAENPDQLSEAVPTVSKRETTPEQNTQSTLLLRRAALLLRDRDWETAEKYYEKVLDTDPENGEAWLGKLMAQFRISREAELERIAPECFVSDTYRQVLRFTDGSARDRLERIRAETVRRTEKQAVRKSSRQQKEDAAKQKQQLKEQQRQTRKEQKQQRRESPSRRRGIVILLGVVIVLGLLVFAALIPGLFGRKDAVTEEAFTQTTGAADFPEESATDAEETLSAEALQYSQAEAWEAEGQLGKAAIAFGKLGDYQDARQRSFALWDKVAVRKTIAVGDYHTLAVKNDGTVMVAGKNIIAVNGITHGATYTSEEDNPCNVGDWSDVVAVSAGTGWSVGLRADGTVLTTKHNDKAVRAWKDIVSVCASNGRVIGLKMDGTLVSNSPKIDVSAVSDAVAVYINGWGNIAALTADGTLVHNWNYDKIDRREWTDLVAVSMTGKVILGLKENGTVVAAGANEDGECNVSEWSDIIDISVSDSLYQGNRSFGVKSDGTVVAAGKKTSWYSTKKWTDIISIASSENHAVGLRSDGTLAVTGNTGYGRCDVSDWTDIKLPN